MRAFGICSNGTRRNSSREHPSTGHRRGFQFMGADQSSNEPGWFPRSLFSSPLDSPAPEAAVQVEFGARSRRGPMRSVNDDHYLILRLGRREETLLTSLPESEIPKRFDGVRLRDGDCRWHRCRRRSRQPARHFQSRSPGDLLRQVARQGGRTGRRRVDGPGATLLPRHRFDALEGQPRQSTRSAVDADVRLSAGTEMFFVHVGHSRAYVFRDDRLVQLTRDHTVASERPARRAIVDVAASARDFHHIVTERLGGAGSDAPRIDVERFGLLDGDVVLLCTNGLTDAVDDTQVANALRSHRTPDEQCGALVDLVVNSGGQDDVTVIIAHYRIASPSDTEDGEPSRGSLS